MTAAPQKASRSKSLKDDKTGDSLSLLTGFAAEQLESRLISNLPAISKRWFPSGQLRGHYWTSPHPTMKGRSISIHLLDGSWREFPTGKSGRTVASLVSHMTGLTLVEAQQKLTSMMEQN